MTSTLPSMAAREVTTCTSRCLETALGGELGDTSTNILGLQLGEPGDVPAHRAGRVVLGQRLVVHTNGKTSASPSSGLG